MARTGNNLQFKRGRYYARLAVPAALQPIIGKRAFIVALGADRSQALDALPEALAGFKREIAAARAQLTGKPAPAPRPSPRRRMSPAEIGAQHLQGRLALDTEIRDSGSALIGIGFPNEDFVAQLRQLAAGRILDPLPSPIALALEWSRQNGNLQDAPGSPNWNATVRMLARAELAAIDTEMLRDEGEADPPQPADLAPVTNHAPGSPAVGAGSPLALSGILPRFLAERAPSRAMQREYEVSVRMFEDLAGEPVPLRDLTRKHVLAFKDDLAKVPSNASKRFPGKSLAEAIKLNSELPKPYGRLDPFTINNKILSRIRTVLDWAKRNDLILENVASGIRVDAPGAKEGREDFSPGDLAKLFHPALFAPDGTLGETQWAMLIALYSGLRPSEAAQMRLDSVRHERGVLCFAVEEETKNAGSRRLVPVHSALIELGLAQRVEALRKAGKEELFPIWYAQGMAARAEAEAKGSATLNQYFPRFIPRRFNVTYMKNAKVIDPAKDFYSFRHTFKTGLIKAGVDKGTADYICGHKDQSAGAVYVHGVSIEAMKVAIEKLHFDGLDLAAIRNVVRLSGE